MNLDEGLYQQVLTKGDRLHYYKELIYTLQHNTNLIKDYFNSVLLGDEYPQASSLGILYNGKDTNSKTLFILL